MKVTRRPRMTRQLVDRLIAYTALAECEYEGWVMDGEEEYAKEVREAEKDKRWLWRLHDWFRRNDVSDSVSGEGSLEDSDGEPDSHDQPTPSPQHPALVPVGHRG